MIKPYDDDLFHFDGAFVIAEKNGKFLLLSRNGSSILISDLLMKNLQKHQCSLGMSIKLMQHGFASIDGINRIEFGNKHTPSYFIIDLTQKCNYDCIYCFRDTNSNEYMRNGKLPQILHYIYQYCITHKKNRISIQAWGGEPLLCYKDILQITDYFKKKGIKAALEIETNASLITDEIAKSLFEHDIRIGVSIDGPERIQVIQRKSCNNESSYDQTCRGISYIKKYYGTRFGSISVVTKYNVGHPEELVDHLLSLGIYNMKFNIVRDNRYANTGGLLPELEKVKEFYTRLFWHVLDYRKKGIVIIESTIHTRYENLTMSSRKNCCESCGCSGGRSILSFDGFGDIYPCEMTDFEEEKLGSIFDGDLDELIDNNTNSFFNKDRTDERCRNCPWLFFCQGGCTSRVLYSEEKGIDEVACVINRTLYPLISKMIVCNHENY